MTRAKKVESSQERYRCSKVTYAYKIPKQMTQLYTLRHLFLQVLQRATEGIEISTSSLPNQCLLDASACITERQLETSTKNTRRNHIIHIRKQKNFYPCMPDRFHGNDFQSQTILKYPTLRPLCKKNLQGDIIIQSQTTTISNMMKPIKHTPPLFIYKAKDLTTNYQASKKTVAQAVHKNNLDLKIIVSG